MPRSPAGPSRLSSYEDAWEAINRLIREGGSWSGRERNCFYLNAGDGTFVNASAASGLDYIEDGRAFAVLDLDRDGDPDLILKNRSGPQVRVLRNDLPPRGGRVAFRLTGRRANRDAVGARITIHSAGRVRTKSLKCGEGFLSQNSPWLLFALPGVERAERVEVRWPGGGNDTFRDLPLGRRYRIVEGEAPVGEDFLVPGPPEAPGEPPSSPDDPRASEAWLLAELLPPDLALEKTGGGAFRPADLRGKEVLLSFYSPRCGICAAELREREEQVREIGAAELKVVLVQVEDPEAGEEASLEAARRAVALAGAGAGAFTAVRAGPRALRAYGVLLHQALRWPRELSVPMHLLLDRGGRVARAYRGPARWERLARDLGLLRQAADPARLGLPFPGTFHTGEPRRDHFRLGIGYFEAGLLELARGAFRRAIELRPEDGESLFNLGVALSEEGEGGALPSPPALEEAKRCFERAVALHPDFVDAHSNLGVALARSGDLAGAESRFAEALRLRPGHAEALLNLGGVRLARGHALEALEAFRSAVEAEPELPAAHKKLGECYRKLGRKEEAIAAFEAAIHLDPNEAEARSNRAVVLAETGRLEEAALDLEAAIGARPRYAAALANLGLVRERQGRDADARRSFRAAIEADPSLPEPYLNLARTLRRAGEAMEARRVLQALIVVHPGEPEAERLLGELGGR